MSELKVNTISEVTGANGVVIDSTKLKDGGVIIADDGNIGSASDTDALAISSAGVVTFTQKPVINSGVAIDNITIDGTEIDLSSGDLTLDVAGDIILDADGGDVKINDGGTAIAELTNSSTDFVIKSVTNDKDIIFKGVDNSSAITALTLDMSAAGAATFNNAITSGAVITSGAGLVIADTGNIGSASDTDAIAIAANGVVTFSQAPVFPDGSLAVADLDIDGATDIGADIADADLFVIDDGAGGTNRKTTAARIKTYIGANTPAFFAFLNSNQGSINDTTFTKVAYNDELFDVGSGFANGTYTIPSAGKYLFSFQVRKSNFSSDRLLLEVRLGGTGIRDFEHGTHSNYGAVTGSFIRAFSANDTIEAYLYQQSGSTRTIRGGSNAKDTWMYGFKIIE